MTMNSIPVGASQLACMESRTIDHAEGSSASAWRTLSRPLWLSEHQWPFATRALEFEGTHIAVTDIGRGPTLLFVHTGFWSFIWRDVIAQLSANFRCVCFDAPGTGQSGRLPVARISLQAASRALTFLVQALGLEDVTLVVHDLGGVSGIVGAARVPDRIAGLCGVNTFGWRPSGAAFRGMLAVMGSASMREFDVITQLLPRITSTAFGVGRHFDAASRKAFFDGIGPQGVRAFHSYLRDVRKSTTVYEPLLKALSGPFRMLPLLTIFGERNDPLGFQPQWKKLYPQARQIVVKKGNHFPMCDAPDLVAASIREFHRDLVIPAIQESIAQGGGRS